MIFSRAVILIFKQLYLKQLFDFRKPSSSMAAAASDAQSLHLIRRYFSLGLNYDEIIASLASNHNIFISKRNLNCENFAFIAENTTQTWLMLHVL